MNPLETKVGESLIRWGIAPSLKGFHYIIDAVCLCDGELSAGEIYWKIADKHNTTYSSVERLIRHAFTKLDFENSEIKQFFGNVERKNYELISLIAWRLRKGEE